MVQKKMRVKAGYVCAYARDLLHMQSLCMRRICHTRACLCVSASRPEACAGVCVYVCVCVLCCAVPCCAFLRKVYRVSMQRLVWMCDAARLGEISKRRAWALLECALASMCFPFSSCISLCLSPWAVCLYGNVHACTCVCARWRMSRIFNALMSKISNAFT